MPIQELLHDPLSSTYLKIILPDYIKREQGMTGQSFDIDPIFQSPKIINKYTLQAASAGDVAADNMPATWEFQGFDDSTSTWVTLDSRKDQAAWSNKEKREFAFNNTTAFNKYRIYVTATNYSTTYRDGIYAGIVVIGDMEMMGEDPRKPEPTPIPEPTPTGDNALLVIKMISGLEKEFELSASEVQDFIDWYNDRADGRGKETYMFDKDFNKGPFTVRKDYVAFSKIQSFEVMEYTK